MKYRIVLSIILMFGLAITANAQNSQEKTNFHQKDNLIDLSSLTFDYHSIEIKTLKDGVDNEFYSGSSFGVKNPVYSAYPLLQNLRFNRVDGLFLGIQQERMSWNGNDFLGIEGIIAHGQLGYSAGQRNWQYIAGLEKTFGVKQRFLIGGEYHNSTSTEDYWRVGLTENSITSVLAGYDFFDYHKMEGLGIYGLVKVNRSVEVGFSYNEDTYSSLNVVSEYTLFGNGSPYRLNPAIDNAFNSINQESITLGLTVNPDQKIKNAVVLTTFSFKAELANLENSHNDFLYNKYLAESKTYFRLSNSSVLQWRVIGGSITGEAPDFKNFALGGIGTMRAMGYKFLKGNQMVLSNIEIEFGRKAYGEKYNWADLKDATFLLFLDSGWSEFNNNLNTGNDPFSGFNSFNIAELSHNIGVGLGLGMLRFEVAKPIAGAQGSTSFWLRLNPTF